MYPPTTKGVGVGELFLHNFRSSLVFHRYLLRVLVRVEEVCIFRTLCTFSSGTAQVNFIVMFSKCYPRANG